MNEPFISIIIPVYNQAGLVLECVKSLVNQDYKNYEVIFVDGLSNDGTWELLEGFKQKEKVANLRLFRKQGNAAAGRNFGIEIAKGKLCAFIDSDALASRDWLNKIAETFESQSEESLLAGVGGINLLPEKSSYKSFVFYQLLGSPLAHGGKLNPSVQHKREVEGFVGHIPTSNLAIKKSVFAKEGKFDESFDQGEDLELSTRLGLKGYKFFCSPKIKVKHYQRRSITKFLKQIYGWGKGKGLIIKKFGLVNKAYLLPLFIIGGLIAIFALSILSNQLPLFSIILWVGLLSYASLVSTESARVASKHGDKTLFLYGLLLFPLIHLFSALGLFKGLTRHFKTKNRRKTGKKEKGIFAQS
jgi:glycosyltransferase involved in cell wall biosynthesis